jgi:hypothetical protein
MSLDERLRRGLPRIAAEADGDVEPALRRAVSGGRRRRRVYRFTAVTAAIVVAGGAAFAGPRVVDAFRGDPVPVRPADTPGDAPVPEPTGTGTVIPPPEGTEEPAGLILVQGDFECGGTVPFGPGYLPAGFSPEPVIGTPPGAPPPEKGQLVVHWTDGQSRVIEARHPGTLFAELAQEDDAPTVTVLGRETTDFGPVVPMEEDYIVQFTIGPRDQRCSLWSLNEYGLPLNQLLRVAEGLVPA